MKAVRIGVCVAVLALMATRAYAIPVLQLDILGGRYDHTTQTIISDGADFTLVALLTPRASNPLSGYLNDTYYISAALTPGVGPADSNLGSFTWNGQNYLVTEDMTYGTPPLENLGAEGDEGDLSNHGHFPTFFREFSFQFSPENRTVTYDSAANPGGLLPTTQTTNISYFATFNINVSMLDDPYELHFDLYNTYLVGCKRNNTCNFDNDEDIASFAPFSHDAESSHSVPEPQSLLLLAAGLLLGSRALKRKNA